MQPDASPTTNRFARFVSGRTSKWLILGFWVVILAVAFSPANKLTGAQENDAVAWLPGDAESTIVLHEMESFQSSDETPAITINHKNVPPVDLTSGRSMKTAAARPTANAVRAMKKKATARGS